MILEKDEPFWRTGWTLLYSRFKFIFNSSSLQSIIPIYTMVIRKIFFIFHSEKANCHVNEDSFMVTFLRLIIKKVLQYNFMHSIFNLSIHREKETSILKDQIEKLNNQINKEETKAADLKIKARQVLYTGFNFNVYVKCYLDITVAVYLLTWFYFCQQIWNHFLMVIFMRHCT